MSLGRPEYISAAQIADTDPDYPWDEWKVRDTYEPVDEELLDRFGVLTQAARVAMTIATAEWAVFRFENLSDDPVPLQYLESAWAANIDRAYGTYVETDDDEWRGPIRGPLNMTITIVVDALFCADQSEDTAENPAWMSKLAERVLPARALPAFRTWRTACLERLERYYSLPETGQDEDRDEFEGLFASEEKEFPVPREVFDPTFDFRPELTEVLLNNYLAGLKPQDNEFLQSPEAMREAGFEGTPYRYNREGQKAGEDD